MSVPKPRRQKKAGARTDRHTDCRRCKTMGEHNDLHYPRNARRLVQMVLGKKP